MTDRNDWCKLQHRFLHQSDLGLHLSLKYFTKKGKKHQCSICHSVCEHQKRASWLFPHVEQLSKRHHTTKKEGDHLLSSSVVWFMRNKKIVDIGWDLNLAPLCMLNKNYTSRISSLRRSLKSTRYFPQWCVGPTGHILPATRSLW